MRRAGLLKPALEQHVSNVKSVTSWLGIKTVTSSSVFCVNRRKNRLALANSNMSQLKRNASTEKTELGLSSSFKFEHPDDYRYKPSETRRPSNAEDVKEIIRLLKEILELQEKHFSSCIVENKTKILCSYYCFLQKEHKEVFLKELATKYAVSHHTVSKAAKQMAEMDVGSDQMIKFEDKLKVLLTPQYLNLFKLIGRLEKGVKFLVDMRTDVLDLVGTITSLECSFPECVPVQQLNITLRDLLSVWFNVGFLQLERITWNSPCQMLQKISEYEAVHPVKSWVDLKRRVGPRRRCFVYTHSSMPGEPIVVLHTAFTKDIVSSVKGITVPDNVSDDTPAFQTEESSNEDAKDINAFIFYSITSTQRGLQGIELGNYMIKRVAQELHSEFPRVTKFSTLSPIPMFRGWLIDKIKAVERGDNSFPIGLWTKVKERVSNEQGSQGWAELRKLLYTNMWYQDPELVALLEHPLMVSCARYLYLEKRRGFAFDNVANFHLRNGAVMWRLNWLADVSPRGLTNSCSLMVNYRYYLDDADRNSQDYLEKKQVRASEQIIKLCGELQSKL